MNMPVQSPSSNTHADLLLLLQAQRQACASDPLPDARTRRDRLDRLLALSKTHARALTQAIADDFGTRPRQETFLAELAVFEQRLKHTRRHLGAWMQRQRVPTSLQYGLAHNWLQPQPLGVVGILSPWNYPFDLSLTPAVDAIGAGNRVMLKPSELCPHFSELLAQRVGEAFDPTELTVVQGDAQRAAAFSALPFDHLLFTGSTAVGRLVAAAAAPNLTPITLELGGKSPVIVDPSCDLARTAERIAWGKLLNAGQTCIAPDYVLAPQAMIPALVEALTQAMGRLYPQLAANPDYTSIISPRHWERLHALVDDARQQGASVVTVNPAGESFAPEQRKLPPHLLTGVHDGMRVMQEEIFGPLLPIVACDTLDEAIAYVNAHDRPLALYWFGQQRQHRERVLRETVSGGVTINDCLLHVSQIHQPFGGIGPSGQGAHHGIHGFRSFTHFKPIFVQSRWSLMSLVNPPYGRLLDLAMRWFER